MSNLFSDYLLNVVTLSPEWLYHKVSPVIRAMVAVAQPGRAPVCGTGGRGFKSRRSPTIDLKNDVRIASLPPVPARISISSASSSIGRASDS